jgi:hypothetical protein
MVKSILFPPLHLPIILLSLTILIINPLKGSTEPLLSAREGQLNQPQQDKDDPDTAGAGTRSGSSVLACSKQDSIFHSFLPENQVGLTTQSRPAIFAQIASTSAKQVILSFQDQTNTYHEIVYLPIPQTPTSSNLISFRLPEDKPALPIKTDVQWKLRLVCGSMPSEKDPVIQGWVKRVPSAQVEPFIAGKTLSEKIKWLHKNDFLYDFLPLNTIPKPDNP